MADTPTTWRSTPVCATEAMIFEGANAIVREFPLCGMDVARAVARLAINAALKASPEQPGIPEPPATGDDDRG